MRRPRAVELASTMAFEFPVILDLSRPSVTLHKNGKFLLFKPNDVAAADVLRELNIRMDCKAMQEMKFYGAEEGAPASAGRVELWKHLQGDIAKHPFCSLLRTYGVEVGTSITLQNYILKEHRRRTLEATPYPASPIVNDEVSLYGRCNEGVVVRCIKDFAPEGHEVLFHKDAHYLVTSTGSEEGLDQITLCTKAITHGVSLDLVGKGQTFGWTELDPPMEEWFDDSENVDFGPTVDQVYPERVAQMEARLAKLSYMQKAVDAGDKLPLYEHVRKDAVLEALKRGVINCKLMRMGKSSEAITICELWGSKKIAIVGSRNVRFAFRKEFQRLGMENFVFVNRFEDLDKEGKYYLFTLDWLKGHNNDPTASPRKDKENYLRASQRTVRRGVAWDTASNDVVVYQHNTCPHCHEALERPILAEEGITTKAVWTQDKGYLCRNPKCAWISDNRCDAKPLGRRAIPDGQSHRGAAWAETHNRIVHHKPGTYVDTMLAQHARCSGEQIKGRMCQECGATDGAWTPPRYRRVKDLYSAVVGDEIHNVKSGTNQQSRAMYSFRARRRIAMTGTLLSNSPLDAYWPLHWAIGQQCEQFPWQGQTGQKAFEARFCDFAYLEKPTGQIDDVTGLEITKTVRKRKPFLINPPDWWKAMQPKIVRRNYTDPLYKQSLVEAGMLQPYGPEGPGSPVPIRKVKVPMDPAQVKLMLAALQDFKVEYQQMVDQAEAGHHAVNSALVIAKMSALKTIATSPERLNAKFGHEVYSGPPGGGKMRAIVNLVTEAVAQGKKVFIISDFVEMQIQVEKALQAFNPIRMPASWGDDKRVEAMELFASDPDRKVWVSGTRTMREAIDASCADVAICCDLLWSPAWQCQAWSRILAPTLRARECTIYLMLSQNSLDEYICSVFYNKLIAAEQAMDRKVMHRRALDFNVKFFAQRVIDEEAALSLQIREDSEDEIYLPEFEMPEERVA